MSDDEWQALAVEHLLSFSRELNAMSVRLKGLKEVFDASNLPVSAAVALIIAGLDRDAEHLKKLAEICDEPAPSLNRFGDD